MLELPQEVLEHFKNYPINNVHPMAALRTAVSLLGLYDEEADLMDKKRTIEKPFVFKQNCHPLLPLLHEFVKV